MDQKLIISGVSGPDDDWILLHRTDLAKLIQELKTIQNARLDQAISFLEELQKTSTPKRRGRKAMSSAERHQVSERMKTYWANRRSKEILANKPAR